MLTKREVCSVANFMLRSHELKVLFTWFSQIFTEQKREKQEPDLKQNDRVFFPPIRRLADGSIALRVLYLKFKASSMQMNNNQKSSVCGNVNM